MSVLSTDHRDHSSSYEHELFSWSSKNSWTERIHNIYITFLLCIRFRFFTTNESDYISVWTKIPIKYSVCCLCLYEWFVLSGLFVLLFSLLFVHRLFSNSYFQVVVYLIPFLLQSSIILLLISSWVKTRQGSSSNSSSSSCSSINSLTSSGSL